MPRTLNLDIAYHFGVILTNNQDYLYVPPYGYCGVPPTLKQHLAVTGRWSTLAGSIVKVTLWEVKEKRNEYCVRALQDLDTLVQVGSNRRAGKVFSFNNVLYLYDEHEDALARIPRSIEQQCVLTRLMHIPTDFTVNLSTAEVATLEPHFSPSFRWGKLVSPSGTGQDLIMQDQSTQQLLPLAPGAFDQLMKDCGQSSAMPITYHRPVCYLLLTGDAEAVRYAAHLRPAQTTDNPRAKIMPMPISLYGELIQRDHQFGRKMMQFRISMAKPASNAKSKTAKGQLTESQLSLDYDFPSTIPRLPLYSGFNFPNGQRIVVHLDENDEVQEITTRGRLMI